jgi:uncharacterized protein (DUF1330 family)
MKKLATAVVALSVGITLAAGWIDVLKAQSAKKRPAYLIAEVIEVTDPPAMQAYAAKVADTLKPYNARVLVSGKAAAKEGESPKGNIIVIAFDSMADAMKWYSTPPYSSLIAERQKAAKARLYMVEGMPK